MLFNMYLTILCTIFYHYVATSLYLMILFVQVGSCDCGLFAVAFATAVAHGKDPLQCTFDQSHMRQHLHKCLSRKRLTPFPEKKSTIIRSMEPSVTDDDIEVHCYCRMPELDNVQMVECTGCFKWFHVAAACCKGSITKNN